MKMDYDHPYHVNDVITISCVAMHNVKQKKNPTIRIKILKPYFSKLFNYIQPTQEKIQNLMQGLCYIVYSEPKVMMYGSSIL
jgi:hypothetical protein